MHWSYCSLAPSHRSMYKEKVYTIHVVWRHILCLTDTCRLIWRHWTNKMLVRYMLPSVCLRLRLFSQLSFIQYIWGCGFSAYPICLSWLWECVLYLIIIIKSEVWIVNHCLGLGHETMVCAVCLTMFLQCRQSSLRSFACKINFLMHVVT